MLYKHVATKILGGFSVTVILALLTFNNLFLFSLNWSGPLPMEFESDDLEYLDHSELYPLQIIKTDSENYFAIFTDYGGYYDDDYFLCKSTNLGEWTDFTDVFSIVDFHYHPVGYPKHLTQLNNGRIQLTIAVRHNNYLNISYRTSMDGESWDQSNETYLDLTSTDIIDFDIYHGDVLVYEDSDETKYLLIEDSYENTRAELIIGYIEQSNSTFIVEKIEYFNEYIRFRYSSIWNDKPVILYGYHSDDAINGGKLGIAIYNNSQWNYFEMINEGDYHQLLRLAEYEDELYIYWRDTREHLQISKISFNYQELNWQKVNSKTISTFDHWLFFRVVENSDKKEIIVSDLYHSIGYYAEEFDTNQLGTYIVKVSLFLVVLILPMILHKIRERKNKKRIKL